MAEKGITNVDLGGVITPKLDSNIKDIPATATPINVGVFGIKDTGASFATGVGTSLPRNVYKDDFINKITNGNSNLDPSVLMNSLVAGQSGWSRAGNSIVQLGATILGGTISGIGSILNLPQTAYNQIADIFTDNRQDKWDSIINEGLGSVFTQAGISLEESARDVFPIHQSQRAIEGGWQGMGDATWWASRFPTIGSAISSMIPVIGSVRGLALAGKGLQSLNSVNRFGKLANAAGRTLSNQKFQTVLGSVAGAHLDSMEEITRGYDEQFQYALGLGFNEEDARNYASTYASTAYNKAWLYGFVFNAIELNSLLKGTNRVSALPNVHKQTQRNIKELAQKGKGFTGLDYAAAQAAEELAQSGTRRVANRYLSPLKDHLEVVFSEGFEEMRVDYALQEGELAAKQRFNIYDPLNDVTASEKFIDFISSNEAWDSFIWGAFGGLAVSGGRSFIQKITNPKSVKEFEERQYKLINDALQTTMETLVDFNGDLSFRPVIKTVTNQDGSVSEEITGIEDPARKLFIPLFNLLGQANAIEYGESFLQEVLNLNDADLSSLYGEGKREVVKAMLKEFKIANRIYSRNRDVSWNSKFDTYIQNHVSSLQYLKDYYERKLGSIDIELQREAAIYNDEINRIDLQLKGNNATRYKGQQAINDLEESNIELLKTRTAKINESQRLTEKQSEYNSQLTEITNQQQELLAEQDRITKNLNEAIRQRNQLVKRRSKAKNAKTIAKIDSDYASNEAYIEKLENDFRIQSENYYRLEEQSDLLQTQKTILKNQVKYNNNIVTQLSTRIEQNEVSIATWDKQISELKASENANVQEYNRLQTLRNSIKTPEGLTLKNIKTIKRELLGNVEQLRSLLANTNDLANTLKTTYETMEKVIEKEEKKKAEPKPVVTPTPVTVTPTETPAVTAPVFETKTENGVTYTIDTNTGDEPNVIVSFIANGRKYSLNDEITFKGETGRITSIQMTSDNRLAFNTILTTGNNKGLSFSGYITDIEINQPQTTIVTELNDILSIYSGTAFLQKFEATLNRLNKFVGTKEYKRLFSTLAYDATTAQERVNILKALMVNIGEGLAKAENVSQEIRDKAESIIATLNKDYVGAQAAYVNAKLYERLNGILDITQDGLASDAYNELINDYIPKLIRTLSSYIASVSNYNAFDNTFSFDKIYGFEDIEVNLNRIVNNFVQNLTTTLYNKHSLESFDYIESDLQNWITEIVLDLENSFKENVKTVIDTINATILVDPKTHKEQAKILEELGEGLDTYREIDKFIEEIATANINYASTLRLDEKITSGRLKEMYDRIASIVNTDFSLVNMTQEQRERFNKSGIERLFDSINEVYGFYNAYVQALSNSNVTEEQALYSINVLANLGTEDYDTDYTGNYIFKPSEYQYYVTPSDLAAFKALDKIAAHHRLLNKYTPNHKLTYTDVLDMIYNSPNGEEKLSQLYEAVWNGLKHIADYDAINALKARIKANVPESNYTEFFNLLDNIQATVRPPLQSIEKKFIDGNDNIRRSYLNEFKKNHKRYAWKNEVHEGVILPNNAIYDVLSSIYDSRTKSIDHTTNIDGIEFTAKELIEAQRNLETGKELVTRIDETTGDIKLYTTINDKPLQVGTLSLNQSFKFGNLPLSKTLLESSGLKVYDSFLGVTEGLSDSANRLISAISNSQRIFDKIREYYKEYYKARQKGIASNPEVQSKLTTLFNELGQINVPEGLTNNTAYNAILAMSNYNTDRENTASINTDAIFNVIEPIFYNVDFGSIDEYVRWGSRIRQTYTNLNTQLATNFNNTQAVKQVLEADPHAKVTISYINKTGISYADSNRSRSNVNQNIERNAEINGQPAVNIVSVQNIDNVPHISSLTMNETIDNDYSNNVLLNPDRHFQLSAQVRLNNDESGVSYIPLKRGHLSYSTSQDNQYSLLATSFVTNAITKIVGDRFATSLSSKPSANSKIDTYVANESFKDTNNMAFNALLDDMSEAIIIDSNHDNNTIPWFNVSALYINTYNDGTSEMSKNIEFITSGRGRRTSYGYNIKVVYDHNENTEEPSKIKRLEITRTRTSANRVRGEISPGFTAKELGDRFGEGGKARIDSKYKKAVININNNEEAENILKSRLFNGIFGNMSRSVNTAYNNGSYTYTSRATGASFGQSFNQIGTNGVIESTGRTNANGDVITHKVFTGQYDSAVLTWAKREGLYNGKTSYNSIQDFYLDTDALTTGSIGVKDNDTNEVITNYQLSGISPKIYVTVESDVVQPKLDGQVNIDSMTVALTKLQGVESPDVNSESNWFTSLGLTKRNYKGVLQTLGIVTDGISDEAAQYIYQLFVDTYSNTPNAPLVLVNTAEEYKAKTGNTFEGDFDNTNGEYIPTKQAIVLTNRIFNNPDSNLRDLGRTLTHETLHMRLRQLILSNKLNTEVASQLNEIVDDLNNLTGDVNELSDFNKGVYKNLTDTDIAILRNYLEAINEAGEAAYSELISYALTDKYLADILNRIEIENPISKTKESFWTRLIDALLDLLGFKNVSDTTALGQVKVIIENNLKGGTQVTSSVSRLTPSPTGSPSSIENVTPTTSQVTQTNRTSDSIVDFNEFTESIDEFDIDGEGLFSLNVSLNQPSREWGETKSIAQGTTPLTNNFVEMAKIDYINSFKDNYIDNNNLKIC